MVEASVRLLVVEDDPDLNRQLTTALSDAGYVVDRAFDGEEGHFLGDSEPYDAVVLDIGLPKMDGISVLESWRRNGRGMPVLILTARDRWSDKVQGFDAGADDYVAKPFHLEEILARIRALLRRSAGHAQSELTCGPVSLDTRTGRVCVSGNPIKMTSHDYRLLAYLMHHPARVVSRTELVEHLYYNDVDRDRPRLRPPSQSLSAHPGCRSGDPRRAAGPAIPVARRTPVRTAAVGLVLAD